MKVGSVAAAGQQGTGVQVAGAEGGAQKWEHAGWLHTAGRPAGACMLLSLCWCLRVAGRIVGRLVTLLAYGCTEQQLVLAVDWWCCGCYGG